MRVGLLYGALVASLSFIAGCASEELQLPEPVDQAPGEYRIGPGDSLSIVVYNHADLSTDVPVRPDGLVNTPLVENMQAAGKTPSELARDIEKRLTEYVRTPMVNVIVKGFVGTYADQVRVLGQAANPQALPYRSGMTLPDGMIAVRGLGECAAGKRPRLIRRVDGKVQEIRLRLDDLINDGDIRANLAVQRGDVIIIPESRF